MYTIDSILLVSKKDYNSKCAVGFHQRKHFARL